MNLTEIMEVLERIRLFANHSPGCKGRGKQIMTEQCTCGYAQADDDAARLIARIREGLK